MICLNGGQQVAAAMCHPCNPENLTVGMLTAIAEARNAARIGDVEVLLRVGARTGGLVAFNEERQAVQLLGCDGKSVTASLKLRNARQVTLARALPMTRERFAPMARVAQAR
jgi:hypothetical protein